MSARIVKPKTIKECVNQLWYAFIGTNGKGLAVRVERIEETMVTKDDLKGFATSSGGLVDVEGAIATALAKKGRNRWLRLKDYAHLAGIVIIIIAFLWGKTPAGGWLSRVQIVPTDIEEPVE